MFDVRNYLMLLNLTKRIKTSLKTDEKLFLDLYAKYNDLNKAAKEAFPTAKKQERKAVMLLQHEMAKIYLGDRREEALRLAREEFKYSTQQHYKRLQAQSEGLESTKEIRKEVLSPETGIIELTEKQYDKLAATKLILDCLGETKQGIEINNINAQSNNNNTYVVELD